MIITEYKKSSLNLTLFEGAYVGTDVGRLVGSFVGLLLGTNDGRLVGCEKKSLSHTNTKQNIFI
jgi:hypothetical protein